MSDGIQSLAKAVKRLEVLAGKGRTRCPNCKLSLRRSWPDPKKPKPSPENLIRTKCLICHSECKVDISHVPENKRDVYRLHYSFTLEDGYTNPKAYALALWQHYWPKRKKKKGLRNRGRVNNAPEARELARMREELREILEGKHKRLRAKYGHCPFPEQIEIVESIQNSMAKKRERDVYPDGLFDLEYDEMGYQICAELEKIIWGDTRPETESTLISIGRKIDELISTAKEEQEYRQQEARRRDREFLNKNRASVGLPPLPVDHE
jgi:hypothetical protein